FPHEVWIKDGKVVARTSGQLNAKNIRAVLDGEPVRMPQKLNSDVGFRADEPLFINGNNGKVDADAVQVPWQSIFTQNYPQHQASFAAGFTPVTGYYIHAVNMNIRWLYEVAFGRIQRKDDTPNNPTLVRVNPNRIALEVPDPEKYLGRRNGEPEPGRTFL